MNKGHVVQNAMAYGCRAARNTYSLINEPPRGKTNNVFSEQVRHKSGCTVTEAGWKLEIPDLKRRGSVLSV